MSNFSSRETALQLQEAQLQQPDWAMEYQQKLADINTAWWMEEQRRIVEADKRAEEIIEAGVSNYSNTYL